MVFCVRGERSGQFGELLVEEVRDEEGDEGVNGRSKMMEKLALEVEDDNGVALVSGIEVPEALNGVELVLEV